MVLSDDSDSILISLKHEIFSASNLPVTKLKNSIMVAEFSDGAYFDDG